MAGRHYAKPAAKHRWPVPRQPSEIIDGCGTNPRMVKEGAPGRRAHGRGSIGRERRAHVSRQGTDCGSSIAPEELATPDAFARDPKLVWEWYDWRRGLIARSQAQSRPLRAGRARKQRRLQVHADHAERGRSARTGRQPQRAAAAREHLDGALPGVRAGTRRPSAGALPKFRPRCECGGMLRPGVVWFGEALPPGVWPERKRRRARPTCFC